MYSPTLVKQLVFNLFNKGWPIFYKKFSPGFLNFSQVFKSIFSFKLSKK